jgi:hypothetical protein
VTTDPAVRPADDSRLEGRKLLGREYDEYDEYKKLKPGQE